jgi:hypothetical protein
MAPQGITINLAADEVLIPEGTYPVEVESAYAKESAGGNVYLSLGLGITEGKHEGNWLWGVAPLREDMRRMLRSTFAAFGVDVDGEVEIEWEEVTQKQWANGGARLILPELVGERAIAHVVHDEWDGELRAKVRRLVKEQA